MKKNFIKLLMVLVTIIAIIILIMPISSYANSNKHQVERQMPYCDTKEGRIVNDMDAYLLQLNEGSILPYDSVIIDYDSTNSEGKEPSRGVIFEPTHSCSNIFGHKWSDWSSWEETGSRIHYPGAPYCFATIERWRYCERTHCISLQKEMDNAWVVCNSH